MDRHFALPKRRFSNPPALPAPEADIGLDYLTLLLDRAQRGRDLLDAYDRDVFEPALAALRERCARMGHRPHDRWLVDGPRRPFSYCHACGQRVD